jgi:phage baseplate assembly protein W
MASLVLDLALTRQTINNPWTYKDVAMPVQADLQNLDIKDSRDYQAINNSISNMFLFIPGENILFPDFGNNLYKYIYEPMIDITAEKMQNEILAMFKRWEPRVKIQTIKIIPDEDNNQYNVEITYTVPSLSRNELLNFNITIRRGEENR